MFFFWIPSNIRAIRDKYKYQVLTFQLSSFSRLKSPVQLVARLKLDQPKLYLFSFFVFFYSSGEQKGSFLSFMVEYSICNFGTQSAERHVLWGMT